MRIDVFTIFPEIIANFTDMSLLGKAKANGLLNINTHDLREFAPGVHKSVDDTPFGGGAGMVMTPGPIFDSVENADPPRPLYLLSPGGRRFNQQMARELSTTDGFSLLCGRYEGVDQRVIDHLVDDELSIGDYVLGGGEVAACVVIEAVTRLVPGVMGNAESSIDESFSTNNLEYPQYTRPSEFRGWTVPETLQSGNHAAIERWRRAYALARTLLQRPDLIDARGGLTEDEKSLMADYPDIAYTQEPASSPETPSSS